MARDDKRCTRQETATLLQCSVRTVDRLIATGRLCAEQTAMGRVYVMRSDIERYVNRPGAYRQLPLPLPLNTTGDDPQWMTMDPGTS